MVKKIWIGLSLCLLISGCQVVSLKEMKLSHALARKNDNFLITNRFSDATLNVLFIAKQNEKTCLLDVEKCIQSIQDKTALNEEAFYAAASEIYLAKAFSLEKQVGCQLSRSVLTKNVDESQACIQKELKMLDGSLRYGYLYLFESTKRTPADRIFDARQNQVRLFYNVALSRLVIRYSQLHQLHTFPKAFDIDGKKYSIDLSQYPELEQIDFDKILSSYNMDFSGFYTINHHDGLGSEFIVIQSLPKQKQNEHFVLDYDQYFASRENPNIHTSRYLAMTAFAEPQQDTAQADQLIHMPFKIRLIDPYRVEKISIKKQDYALTANYSAPYGLWLAQNNLGILGYLTLLNHERNLIMPHLYKLEPYNPNKKIIVFIHGLASSPEAWIALTNDIMGDDELRKNYQVWQVFYSTNMPIFESRYQIDHLLRQAFSQTVPNSESSHDAVLIGHSMGGVISRLLMSHADIRQQAEQLMNARQKAQLQKYPVIEQRFMFEPLPQVSRVVFVSAPHQGTDYADRWFTKAVRKIVRLPTDFFDAVEAQPDVPSKRTHTDQLGLIDNGPSDLSRHSAFMQLTHAIMPVENKAYHSIMGNLSPKYDPAQMSDGIVPYQSSHLPIKVASELIISGGHSIQTGPEAIIEMRRILKQHLMENP